MGMRRMLEGTQPSFYSFSHSPLSTFLGSGPDAYAYFEVKARKQLGRSLHLTLGIEYFYVPSTLEETPRDAWSPDRDVFWAF